MIDEKYKIAANIINETIPVTDVAKELGFDIGRKNRCKCPFHNGEHENLRLYDGNRGYYCFVCHAYGKSLDFAMKVMNISFVDALRWFDTTYNLNLDIATSFNYRKKRALKK